MSDEANESVDGQQQLLVSGACAEVIDANMDSHDLR